MKGMKEYLLNMAGSDLNEIDSFIIDSMDMTYQKLKLKYGKKFANLSEKAFNQVKKTGNADIKEKHIYRINNALLKFLPAELFYVREANKNNYELIPLIPSLEKGIEVKMGKISAHFLPDYDNRFRIYFPFCFTAGHIMHPDAETVSSLEKVALAGLSRISKNNTGFNHMLHEITAGGNTVPQFIKERLMQENATIIWEIPSMLMRPQLVGAMQNADIKKSLLAKIGELKTIFEIEMDNGIRIILKINSEKKISAACESSNCKDIMINGKRFKEKTLIVGDAEKVVSIKIINKKSKEEKIISVQYN